MLRIPRVREHESLHVLELVCAIVDGSAVGIDLGFEKKFNASLSGRILKIFFLSKTSFY